MKLFGLADCNNFYCSCERVFHPDLRNKPVVVLSNNDGCVIARSEESKALGIKMGDVFYQVKDVLEKNGVAVFSSNYNLYGDMSRRVMFCLICFDSLLSCLLLFFSSKFYLVVYNYTTTYRRANIDVILIIVVRCERVDFIVSHTTTATCFDLVQNECDAVIEVLVLLCIRYPK